MKTGIRALAAAGAAFAMGMVGNVTPANAKAMSCESGEVTVEAIITQVDKGENSGDTDYNFYLRPLRPASGNDPGEPSAFPNAVNAKRSNKEFLNTFWHPECTTPTDDGTFARVVAPGDPDTIALAPTTVIPFWDYGGNWVKDVLVPSMPWATTAEAAKAKMAHRGGLEPAALRRFVNMGGVSPQAAAAFSDACTQCVESQGGSMACKIKPESPTHSCPEFFSCGACIWDMRRLNGKLDDVDSDYLSNFTAKAEVFTANPRWPGENANNLPLSNAMSRLGLNDPGTQIVKFNPIHPINTTEDLWVFCKEFTWNGKGWTQAISQVCGKHVLITGRVVFDAKHMGRPEIHPVSRMVIADRELNSPNAYKKYYKVGTFIDGSARTLFGATPGEYDYRANFGPAKMPNKVLLPLKEFLPKGPPSTGAWLAPRCSVYPTSSDQLNAKLVSNPPGQETWDCNAMSAAAPLFYKPLHYDYNDVPFSYSNGPHVSMEFKGKGGARWDGEIAVGWSKSTVQIEKISSVLLGSGGVLAYAPPTLDASSLPSAASNVCDVQIRAGEKSRNAPKRWYLWKIETSVGNKESHDLHWDLTAPKESLNTFASATGWSSKGGVSAAGWISTNQLQVELRDQRVSGENLIARETRFLDAPHPTVMLKTDPSSSKFAIAAPTGRGGKPRLNYMTSLGAVATGFCGEAGKWRYEWKKKGKRSPDGKALPDVPVSGAGAGPIAVSLGAGEQETYEVTVFDPWNAESAHDTIVIAAPQLVAPVKESCNAIAETGIIVGPGPKQKGEGQSPPKTVRYCKSQVLTAAARYTPGVGATWTDVPPGAFAYEWTDLKYRTPAEAEGKFTTIPAEWMGVASSQPSFPGLGTAGKAGNWGVPPLPAGPAGRALGQFTAPSRPVTAPSRPVMAVVRATTAAVTITPSLPPGPVWLQAMVKVTDSYGSPPAIVSYAGSTADPK